MRRVSRCTLWMATAALAAAFVFWADPVLAQEAGKKAGKVTSAFKMFFWVDDDIFGLLMIWVLILMSVWVVALVIQHAMLNKKSAFVPPDAIPAYAELLELKRYSEAIERASTDRSVFGQILHASLSEASNGYGAMERAVEETADMVSSKRMRAMEMLNVLGAVGPMVGLFGTVYGMIGAFYTIVDLGGQPQPADLAAGIATALVTTFWGLIVGIPAVAAVALIRSKIDGQMVEAMVQVEQLISRFRPTRKPQPAPAAARPAPAPKTKSATPAGA